MGQHLTLFRTVEGNPQGCKHRGQHGAVGVFVAAADRHIPEPHSLHGLFLQHGGTGAAFLQHRLGGEHGHGVIDLGKRGAAAAHELLLYICKRRGNGALIVRRLDFTRNPQLLRQMGQLTKGFPPRGKQRIVSLSCRKRNGQAFAGAHQRLQYPKLLTGKIRKAVYKKVLPVGIVPIPQLIPQQRQPVPGIPCPLSGGSLIRAKEQRQLRQLFGKQSGGLMGDGGKVLGGNAIGFQLVHHADHAAQKFRLARSGGKYLQLGTNAVQRQPCR